MIFVDAFQLTRISHPRYRFTPFLRIEVQGSLLHKLAGGGGGAIGLANIQRMYG